MDSTLAQEGVDAVLEHSVSIPDLFLLVIDLCLSDGQNNLR